MQKEMYLQSEANLKKISEKQNKEKTVETKNISGQPVINIGMVGHVDKS